MKDLTLHLKKRGVVKNQLTNAGGANLHKQRLCSYVVKSKGHINSLFGAETKKMQYLNKTVQDNGRNVQHLVVPNLMIEPIKEEHSLGAANFFSTGSHILVLFNE